MKEETILLETPDGDCQKMKVQRLDENIFLCKSFIDAMSTFHVFHNDRFEAKRTGEGSWQFLRFIEPFAYVRYKLDLGLFCAPSPECSKPEDISTKKERLKRNAQDLSEVIMDGYITEELRNFLDDCHGIWEFDSLFGAFVIGYLHIPNDKHETFLEQFSSLCPNIKPEEMKQVFSGLDEDYDF